MVLLGSPTGWTAAACRIVTDANHLRGFSACNMAVVLWDLHSDEVFLDAGNEVLSSFWSVVAPARFADEVTRCVDSLHDILLHQDSMSLIDAVRACKGVEPCVREAFGRLEGDGRFKLDELKGIGLVLSRIAR